jgi:hypothetical protein
MARKPAASEMQRAERIFRSAHPPKLFAEFHGALGVPESFQSSIVGDHEVRSRSPFRAS